MYLHSWDTSGEVEVLVFVFYIVELSTMPWNRVGTLCTCYDKVAICQYFFGFFEAISVLIAGFTNLYIWICT